MKSAGTANNFVKELRKMGTVIKTNLAQNYFSYMTLKVSLFDILSCLVH